MGLEVVTGVGNGAGAGEEYKVREGFQGCRCLRVGGGCSNSGAVRTKAYVDWGMWSDW